MTINPKKQIKWLSRLNFKIYQPIVFYIRCNDVTKTQTESGTEVLQMQQDANMNLYTPN
jgi:hypothetical protein